MSRVAKQPVIVPEAVTLQLTAEDIVVKGKHGELRLLQNPLVEVKQEEKELHFSSVVKAKNTAMAGTMRSLVANMVEGVSNGFEKKLLLVGVGYRAQAKGNLLTLNVGYSHPVEVTMPDGVSVQTPSNTEVIISGADKQLVGQVAANIRKVRSPEPYKGKGIRYANEHIVMKEAKKK